MRNDLKHFKNWAKWPWESQIKIESSSMKNMTMVRQSFFLSAVFLSAFSSGTSKHSYNIVQAQWCISEIWTWGKSVLSYLCFSLFFLRTQMSFVDDQFAAQLHPNCQNCFPLLKKISFPCPLCFSVICYHIIRYIKKEKMLCIILSACCI